MELYLLCLFLLVVVKASENIWETYKIRHGKAYDEEQDTIRRANFERMDTEIRVHNRRFESGLETFSMEHNAFSDLSREQKIKRLGKRRVKPYKKSTRLSVRGHTTVRLPASYDLRKHKCMPAIKNQGLCGSCWAFATVTPIEFQKCVRTKKLVTLSEQQLIDCTYAPSYNGCDGGDHHDPWFYLYRSQGLSKSSDYRYRSGLHGRDFPCRSRIKAYVKLANAGIDLPQNETAIQAALVARGPLTTAYYVSSKFFYYKNGVFSDSTCKKGYKSLNHEMVIVGYGALNKVPYWIVRNTWGTSWGQRGYVFIRRGTNECGIAVDAGYPTVI